MDLLGKIKQYEPHKPRTWQRIANFVCEHPREVAGMKISDLQQCLSVSAGSIINFVQSLGCSGYAEFRVWLSQSDEGFRKTLFATIETDIVERITGELTAITQSLDTNALDALAARIAAGGKVYFLGVHTSAHMAQILAGYLVRLGVLAFVLGEDRTRTCALLGKNDTVIAISFSGGTDVVVTAARNAKKAGATVACITSFAESELARLCDIVLRLDTTEAKNGDFPLLSRICQLAVGDMLLSRVSWAMQEREIAAQETKENNT